jgi:transposase
MADLKEQSVCIKFCLLLGKTAAETATMLREAFKEETLSEARVYEWFSWFKHGDMSLEDQPRSGRPSTSRNDENIQKFCDVIMFDCRRKIDELEVLTGVSWSSCQLILTEELHMRRVAVKFIPHLLSEDQH